jgi:hypothetical protein
LGLCKHLFRIFVNTYEVHSFFKNSQFNVVCLSFDYGYVSFSQFNLYNIIMDKFTMDKNTRKVAIAAVLFLPLHTFFYSKFSALLLKPCSTLLYQHVSLPPVIRSSARAALCQVPARQGGSTSRLRQGGSTSRLLASRNCVREGARSVQERQGGRRRPSRRNCGGVARPCGRRRPSRESCRPKPAGGFPKKYVIRWEGGRGYVLISLISSSNGWMCIRWM